MLKEIYNLKFVLKKRQLHPVFSTLKIFFPIAFVRNAVMIINIKIFCFLDYFENFCESSIPWFPLPGS